MTLPSFLTWPVRKFLSNQKGYVAVLFGLLALPIMGIIGGAMDYRSAGREQVKMRAAAEAAAIAVARAEFKIGRPGLNPPPENTNDLYRHIFDYNYQHNPAEVTSVNTSMAINATDRTVTITASASVNTILLKMIGFNTLDVEVSARAAAVFSDKNIEFDILMDWSPSMGAPGDGTAIPLTTTYAPPGGGCFFMCHDDGSTIRGAGKVPKMDTVYDEIKTTRGVLGSLETAAASNPVPIGVNYYGHRFERNFVQNGLYATSTAGAAQAALNSGYILGSQGANSGTDLNTAFYELDAEITKRAVDARHIVLIISDGVHARSAKPFDPAMCTALKNGREVYTMWINNPIELYDNPNITYQLPDSSYAKDTWDLTTWEGGPGGNHSGGRGYYSGTANAGTLMRNCASKPEWAFQGTRTPEIQAAFNNLIEVMIAPDIRVIN